MNTIIKNNTAKCFALILFLFIQLLPNIEAQNQSENRKGKGQHGIEIGYTKEFFHLPDLSLYTGYNYDKKLNNFFSLQGQTGISYSKYSEINNFFSRNAGQKLTASVFGGLKTYFLPAKYTFRMYIQTLAGIHYTSNYYANEELTDDSDFGLAGSFGIFGEYKRMYGGITLERDVDHLILKVGYKL